MVVFAIAFIYTKNHDIKSKILLGCAAGLLAIIMFFYYRNKVRISKGLKHIANVEEYEQGGMVKSTYILEDRMLVFYKFQITEHKTIGITSLTYEEGKHGKGMLKIDSEEGKYQFESDSIDQAKHFASFLKRKNANIKFNNIHPEGNGTLKELGAIS